MDHFRKNIFGIAQILILVAIVFVALLINNYDKQLATREARSETIELGTEIANSLRNELAVHETIAKSVAAMGATFEEFDDPHFELLAEKLTQENAAILNLAYAPNLVVQYVFPYDRNKSVIGLDYRVPSPFTVGVQRALTIDDSVLVGPINVMQGGRALILRVPVLGKARDGTQRSDLVSLLLDLEALVDQAGVRGTIEDISLSVSSYDPETLETYPVIGEGQDCSPTAISRSFSIIDRHWTFCMSPKGGWPATGQYAVWILLLTLATLISTLTAFLVINRLRASETAATAQLWDAIEAINDGFALFDKDDRLLICNMKFLEIYPRTRQIIRPGVTFREIIEYGVWQGEYPEAIGKEEEWLEKRMAVHRDPSGKYEHQLQDGRWIKVAERKTSSGGTVGFRVDVTDLKVALQKAETSERVTQEFLNNINHEIRTPLSVIVGFIKFLAKPTLLKSHSALKTALDSGRLDATREAVDGFVGEISSLAGRVEVSSNHLHSIVQDTLDMSKITTGNLSYHPKTIDLKNLLSECICQFSHQAAQKNIELRLDIPPSEIEADPTKLRQIILNLIGNAVKFTEQGHITVRARMQEDSALIEVEDTGPGVAEEHRTKIFERFWQVDGSVTRQHSGTGLGLAICEALTKLHGGRISVATAATGGSLFRVHLPQGFGKQQEPKSERSMLVG